MTENFKQEIIKKATEGFMQKIGFALTEIGDGYAKGELDLTELHANPIGSTHGGVIFSIGDTVGGAAAISKGRHVTAVSGGINYLNPAMNCKKLIGEAKEIKTGKTIGVYEVCITDENGRKIAVSTMTYYYMRSYQA